MVHDGTDDDLAARSKCTLALMFLYVFVQFPL